MAVAAEMAAWHREAVERGMALLDEKRPEWLHRVNTVTLSMIDGRDCMLGQEYRPDTDDYGAYYRACEMLGLEPDESGTKSDGTNASYYGFAILETDVRQAEYIRQDLWDDLTQAWIDAITTRRAAE